jgi:hypothetical protein
MSRPYVSHSFNLFIRPIDNGFIFADHGDAFPRAFTFSKLQNGIKTRQLNGLKFPGLIGENATYAEMGGVAKTENGYIFIGTYGGDKNNPRNVIILNFNEDMTTCSEPIYITNYTQENGHAGHPKIAALDSNRYLIMWELFNFSTQYNSWTVGAKTEYLSTFMAVINENGALLSPVQKINARLNMNDTLRYSKINGNVYWAINDGDRIIGIYALNPDIINNSNEIEKTIEPKITGEPITKPEKTDEMKTGETTEPKKSVEPTKKTGQKVKRKSDLSLDLGFDAAIGLYANGWHQNLFSAGVPLQAGLKLSLGGFALALLGEGGVGIGSSSFTDNLLLEWNYGGMGELYFIKKKFGVGFGYGIVDSKVLKNYKEGVIEPTLFNTTYMRFGLIYRKLSKTTIYAQLYGDGKWGFGLQFSGILTDK